MKSTQQPLLCGGVLACLLILVTTVPASALKVAPTNLALNRAASQSSTSQWSRSSDAQGAVDGVINGSFGFHTAQEVNPWWQVDLGALYLLAEVRIFNRLDGNSERARSIEVLISPDGREWRSAYVHDGTTFFGKGGHPLVVSVAGVRARFVRLRLNATEWFHLDEVEVYGFTTEDGPFSGTAPTLGGAAVGSASAAALPVPPRGASQHSLEAEYARRKELLQGGRMTQAELLGTVDEWMLGLGNYRLLLNPLTGKWHYYDRVHAVWEETGFASGTVRFALEAGRLVAQPAGTISR